MSYDEKHFIVLAWPGNQYLQAQEIVKIQILLVGKRFLAGQRDSSPFGVKLVLAIGREWYETFCRLIPDSIGFLRLANETVNIYGSVS